MRTKTAVAVKIRLQTGHVAPRPQACRVVQKSQHPQSDWDGIQIPSCSMVVEKH